MEGEVSNHDCADGAASVENNGCMRGKCRGGGEFAVEAEEGGEVIAERGFKGREGTERGLREKRERGGLMSGRECG